MENSSEKIPSTTRFTFNKEERLCSKKQMDKLFSEGSSFLVYPLKVVYSNFEFPGPYPARAAFAVSKKLYKKAVQRNTIKRRMREAYRLNKHIFYSSEKIQKTVVIFIFIGKTNLDYNSIEKAIQKSLTILLNKANRYP